MQGGEFSTHDLWKQRERKQALIAEADSLTREVDSLAKELELVENDRLVQERIAREEFGLVKGDRELLYRFSEGVDSARR